MQKRRYPGIKPFEAEDTLVFKGRSEETREVTNLILSQKTLILFANSGMGKTSLLNAGVMPNLRQYGLYPIFIRFNQISSPGMNPLERFIDTYQKAYETYSAYWSTAEKFVRKDTLWETMCQNQFLTLDQVLIPTLVFDQFEEFFHTYPKREDRQAFLRQLGELISDAIPHQRPLLNQPVEAGNGVRPLNLRIVFSIRADSLNSMQEVSEYLTFVLRTRYELLPMLQEQATLAIQEPGLVTGSAYKMNRIIFPAEVIDNILNALVDKHSLAIETFLLQLVCSTIEEKLIEESKQVKSEHVSVRETVQPADYGGDKNGINTIAENYFRTAVKEVIQHDHQPQPRTEDILYKLLAIGSYISGWWYYLKRRPAVVEALKKTLNNAGSPILTENSQLLLTPTEKEAFIERRILKSEERGPNTYFEISHNKIALALKKERARIKQADKDRQKLILLGLAGLLILGLLGVIIYLLTRNKSSKLYLTKYALLVYRDTTLINNEWKIGDTLFVYRDTTKSDVTVPPIGPESTPPIGATASVSSNTESSGGGEGKPSKDPTQIPALLTVINQLNEDRLKRAQEKLGNAKKLMEAHLFAQALRSLPTEPEFNPGFLSNGLVKFSESLLKGLQDVGREVKKVESFCKTMQPVQELVEKAVCMEASLSLKCANKYYRSAQDKNEKANVQVRYKVYKYEDRMLKDKIYATNHAAALGVYAGLNDETLDASYKNWADGKLKNIRSDTCICKSLNQSGQ